MKASSFHLHSWTGIPPHRPHARPTNTLGCSALAADKMQPWRLKLHKPVITNTHIPKQINQITVTRFTQIILTQHINHMWENMETHITQTHAHADLLTVGAPWDRRCQEVNIIPSFFLPLFPWRLNLQCYQRWGGKTLSLHMNTCTHTACIWPDWLTNCQESVGKSPNRTSEYQIWWMLFYTLHTVYSADYCGTWWYCVLRVTREPRRDDHIFHRFSINQAPARCISVKACRVSVKFERVCCNDEAMKCRRGEEQNSFCRWQE